MSTPENPHTLQVDFKWKNFQFLVQDKQTQKPLIIVKHKCLVPHLIFVDAETEKTMGTATLHYFSIHADCTIGSQSIQLKAQKRLTTKYSYFSHAYSDDEKPVVMTWIGSANLKKWDFTLLDENQEAVARYSTNIWALRKVGDIEFVGPKAGSRAVRDEVAITVCTIYYCMAVRSTNMFSLFGTAFSDVKPLKAEEERGKEVSEVVS
ncbi:uncharacterized protein RCC_07325 [Ramularia collo-cygni]|uniref:Uncharacterized protein n=1 Tax=Ramularia collo-cygni TaxID=112498 RepID=A0A2D3UUX5_9PEZI|nr:uncharacterized protein RCC_07325 [Ramularia collo-cygni]CZT21462.1 uncharacterized protein RCC_07325 [Ramularia collo-cygni]